MNKKWGLRLIVGIGVMTGLAFATTELFFDYFARKAKFPPGTCLQTGPDSAVLRIDRGLGFKGTYFVSVLRIGEFSSVGNLTSKQTMTLGMDQIEHAPGLQQTQCR